MALRYVRRGSSQNNVQHPPAQPNMPARTVRQVAPKPIDERSAVPQWFDPDFYFHFYPDIKQYYGQVKVAELFAHYNDFGLREGRYPSRYALDAFNAIQTAKARAPA